jgi:hypothetical protein
MADRWFSTPETGSNGKRKRSRQLCGGRRNSRQIELEIEECIGKVRGQDKELVRDSCLDSCVEVRREISFSESGVGTEANTPTGEISVPHKGSSRIGAHSTERTADYVDENQGISLVEGEGLMYVADEHLIPEIDVDDPNVDEDELELDDVVGIQVVEDENELVCDAMEQNIGNERRSTVPSSDDAIRIRYEAEKLASVLLKPKNLIALMLTSGTQRFTREQFEEHSRIVDMCSRGGPSEMRYPCYTTLKTKVEPRAIEFSYAGSFIRKFLSSQSSLNPWEDVSLRVAIESTGHAGQGTDGTNQSRAGERGRERPVVIVPPSQWALLDVSTGPIFRSMFMDKNVPAVPMERAMFDTIEDCPIVSDRERIMNCHTSVCAPPLCDDTTYGETSHPKLEALPVPVFSGQSLLVTISDRKKTIRQFLGTRNVEVSECGSDALIKGLVLSVHVHGMLVATSAQNRIPVVPLELIAMLRSGDYVVSLQAERTEGVGNRNAIVLLLIYRFWRKDVGEPYIFLLIERERAAHFAPGASCVLDPMRVKHVAVVSSVRRPEVRDRSVSSARGHLQDGRPYLVYRMVLYSDDFKPYVGKKDSYGGCYMLPLGLPPESRAGAPAVRVLGLTPPGVSTNEVIRAIIPDIIRGTTEGFKALDANGMEVVVFLDVVGFIGDTPAIAHVVGALRGHNGLAPCTWCTFKRNNNQVHKGSRYGAPVTVNSRHSSFTRFGHRASIFHEAEPTEADCQELGFQYRLPEKIGPLHELANALSECRTRVPVNTEGNPVVPACFDPFRACVVAPDHLFFGLSQNVITAVLSCCSVKERNYAEACILIALRNYDLPVQNKLFGESGAALLPMSISQVRSLLLVSPAVFRSVRFLHECQNSSVQRYSSVSVKPSASQKISVFDRVINLIERFQTLVAETTFYPVPELDGSALVREFNKDSGEYRMEMLYGMACDYVKELDGVCALSQKLKDALDKPNVHRLIELYAHTIPAYGHVKHVAELLFESAHQPLKRAINGSNHHDPQIAAVHSALENDLESRLALELQPDQPESMRRQHRIQRLLLGRDFPSWLKEESFASTDPLNEPYLLDRLSRLRRKVYSDTSSKAQWILKEELVQSDEPDPAAH